MFLSGTRQQLLGVAGGGSSREPAAAAATAGHEDGGYGSKIYLEFCQKAKCDGAAGRHDYTCYCCVETCWMTMEDCRRSCPVCDPKCHPPLPLAARRRPTLSGGGVAPGAGDYKRASSLVGR
ncbi:unnamed protein product [Urochloa humidicola]